MKVEICDGNGMCSGGAPCDVLTTFPMHIPRFVDISLGRDLRRPIAEQGERWSSPKLLGTSVTRADIYSGTGTSRYYCGWSCLMRCFLPLCFRLETWPLAQFQKQDPGVAQRRVDRFTIGWVHTRDASAGGTSWCI